MLTRCEKSTFNEIILTEMSNIGNNHRSVGYAQKISIIDS